MKKMIALLSLLAFLVGCSLENESTGQAGEPLLDDEVTAESQIRTKYSELRLSCTFTGRLYDGEYTGDTMILKKRQNSFLTIDVLNNYNSEISAGSGFHFGGAFIELGWELRPSIIDSVSLEIIQDGKKDLYELQESVFLESRISFVIDSDIDSSTDIHGVTRYNFYERVPVKVLDHILSSPSEPYNDMRVTVHCQLESKLKSLFEDQFKKSSE